MARKKTAGNAKPPAPPSPPPAAALAAPPPRTGPPPEKDHFPIVGIGASAGGLEAYKALLHNLSADTGMAFVLVPHLAPTHASMLVEILGRETSMPVSEVHEEPEVLPNHVYIIPLGRNMMLS